MLYVLYLPRFPTFWAILTSALVLERLLHSELLPTNHWTKLDWIDRNANNVRDKTTGNKIDLI